MPLLKSKRLGAVAPNIETEENAGKPPKQAVAIALNTAREAGAKIPPKKKRLPPPKPLANGSDFS